jgi:hypothetical protein
LKVLILWFEASNSKVTFLGLVFIELMYIDFQKSSSCTIIIYCSTWWKMVMPFSMIFTFVWFKLVKEKKNLKQLNLLLNLFTLFHDHLHLQLFSPHIYYSPKHDPSDSLVICCYLNNTIAKYVIQLRIVQKNLQVIISYHSLI